MTQPTPKRKPGRPRKKATPPPRNPTPSIPNNTSTSNTTLASHFKSQQHVNPYLPPSSTPSALTSPDSKVQRLASLYNENKDDRPRARKNNLVRAAQQLNILNRSSQGHTLEQIAFDLDLPLTTVAKDLQHALDALVRHFSQPSPEHTFVRYAQSGYSRIHSLQRLINALEISLLPPPQAHPSNQTNPTHPSTPHTEIIPHPEPNAFSGRQATAIIQAHKACWAIETDILNKGIDMGVIQAVSTVNDTQSRLQRTDSDLLDELKRKILTLCSYLDHLDPNTTRTFTRARSSSPYPHTPILREPLQDPYGIIFGISDWKYKKHLNTEDGRYIPVSERTHLQDTTLSKPSTKQHILFIPPPPPTPTEDSSPSS